MVRLLALIFVLFAPPSLLASQLDDFLGPSDPSYFRKVAPRFIDWSSKNFRPQSPKQADEALKLIRQQTTTLDSWSFPVVGDLTWSRLQFGIEFQKGKETSAFIAIFPEEPQKLRKDLLTTKSLPRLPESLQKNLIGIGYDFLLDQSLFFSKELIPANLQIQNYSPVSREAIRRSVYSGSALVSSALFIHVTPPKEHRIHFAALVENWGIWISPEGRVTADDLDLARFNLYLLDGAAIRRSRQIGSEFLLNVLRIEYRANDDYKIIYP